MIDAQRAAREGKRFHAFYCGFRDVGLGRTHSPYAPGTDEDSYWKNGRRYAEERT